MSLDSSCDLPNECARGGGVDTDVGVAVGFEAEGRHFLFALVAEHNDGLIIAAAGANGVEHFQGIESTLFVAHQYGIEQFIPQFRQAACDSYRFGQKDLAGAVRCKCLG